MSRGEGAGTLGSSEDAMRVSCVQNYSYAAATVARDDDDGVGGAVKTTLFTRPLANQPESKTPKSNELGFSVVLL